MEKLHFIFVFFLGFCLVIQTSCLYSTDSVPVLIWSNERQPLDTPAVSAIPIPFSHVEGKYLKSFNQNNVILFLQDTLSVEDLSSHEDVFQHVSKYMEGGHSLYLPALEVGTSLPHTFAAQGYNIITLEPGSAIGELKLKEGSRNLVLVKLPPTTTNPSRQRALQKSDEIIGNVISKIGKLTDFTVMYTGVEPSVKLVSRVEHRRTIRAVRRNASDDSNFFATDCILLYLRNGFLVQEGNTSFILNNNDSTAQADCAGDVYRLNINYKDVGELKKVKVTIYFSRVNRYWFVEDIVLSLMKLRTTIDKITLLPQWPMEHVPLNKSYACSKKLVFISNETEPVTGFTEYKLTMEGIQIQAFTGGQKRFDDSWDCVGFFTIPIWMGLFSGILLTLIFLFGMFMLLDIKTMDRFDDPKGKHFVVTGVSE